MKEKPRRMLRVAADKNWLPGNSIQQKNRTLESTELDVVKSTQTLYGKKSACLNCLSAWKGITKKTEDAKWMVNIVYSDFKEFYLNSLH